MFRVRRSGPVNERQKNLCKTVLLSLCVENLLKAVQYYICCQLLSGAALVAKSSRESQCFLAGDKEPVALLINVLASIRLLL